MALPTFPQAVADYIAGLTDEDFINGGHRTHFIPTAQGGMTLADYVRLAAIEMLALAEQVEDDAASAAAGSGTEATVANIRAAADVAHYISMRRVVAANVPVSLTDGPSIAWDMATGINFTVTIAGASRTLANPTNQTAGKSGFIDFAQDGTGGRKVTTWGSNFKWFGPHPDWPTTAGAITKVAYFVKANGEIHLAFAGNAA